MEKLLIKPQESYIALQATNREDLIDYAHNIIDVCGKGGSFLRIKSPCGSADYKTEADIPYQSVPCPCGKHWLIKYNEGE